MGEDDDRPQGSEIDVDTLEEARDFLKTHAAEGVSCPVCEQFVKKYRRPLNSTMVRQLGALYHYDKKYPRRWVHAPTYLTKLQLDRECAKLRHFGLIRERVVTDRGDGSKHAGYYRITKLGVAFMDKKAVVPKYVVVYLNKVIKVSKKTTDVVTALRDKFSYTELMRRAP